MEENMPASDILSLRVSMAERAIRLLYAIALILIALAVLFGLWRGGVLMTRTPMQPPQVSANTNPSPPATTTAPQTPPQGVQGFRGGPRFMSRDRRRFFMMRRHPMRAGIFMIIGTLVRGFIALLLVRILAELGLAILAIPRRA
jgi:hypothetical protein